MRALLPVMLAATLANHALLLALTRRGRAAWRLPVLAAMALAASLLVSTRFNAPQVLQEIAQAFALVAAGACLGAADARAPAGATAWRRHLHLASGLLGAGIAALALFLLRHASPSPAALLAPSGALLAIALAWPALQERLASATLRRGWTEGAATLALLALPALALAGLGLLRA